jgi:hypothetical protein
MDTENPYPGRVAHWVKHNHTERMPHRWIVADSEAYRDAGRGLETQTLRCVDATRWRDDLATGDHAEDYSGEGSWGFWQWVDEYCRAGARTVLWFHHASYDLRTLNAFKLLPDLGWQLEWCNLDRDVSVATFRSDHGTLVIADTYTWLAKPLADVSGMVGIGKPALPADDDSLSAWHQRCRADVEITRAAVMDLLSFVRSEHLGNWQPSGAGMGYATWRHRFLTHKVLVHDDAPAIAAERAAMHAGRAEAWWHGKCERGRFTEWDMHMAYCRIASECPVPVRLYAHDPAPTPAVHEWARKHWTLLARVVVTTDQPVVPHQDGERTLWPVGTFETTLWQPELDLIRATGGSYTVLEQWRYVALPALKEWADWSMAMCDPKRADVTPVQRAWVKHQSRALIGRLALRNKSWEQWGANPYGWCGLTDLVDGETGEVQRMMHVGDRTFVESERSESQSSLPQITGYIMSVARVRLWDAATAAGLSNVLHIDTDSLITNRDGTRNLEKATSEGLPGGWRPKDKWGSLTVTGPRHYRSSGRRVIPGVPVSAVEVAPGRFEGQVWESLATSLQAGRTAAVRVVDREWCPRQFDGRRPWTGEGPAQPPRLPLEDNGRAPDDRGDDSRADGMGVPARSRPGRKRESGDASGGDGRDRQQLRHAPDAAGRSPAAGRAPRTVRASRPAGEHPPAAAHPAAVAARGSGRKVSDDSNPRQRRPGATKPVSGHPLPAASAG